MFPTTPPIEGILVEIAGTTRRTIAVVDPHDATLFNEPGPFVSLDEWHSLVNAFETALDRATLVVLSGSLPPGAPIDAYAQLTELATRRSVPVIVDAEGEPLHRALSARPYLIKPNLAELRTIVDGPLDTLAEITSAGKELRRRGARNVVVSCGRDGLIAITEDGQWQAKGPSVEGNPTGAGDALVAALSAGTVRDDPWEQRLRDGVAWSAAAVAAPLAGQVDPATATALALGVRLEQLPEPRTTPSEVLIENPVDLEPGRESAH
jgi:tagatose 6-phosphate kinase